MQNTCIALIGLLLSGCSSFNYDKPDSLTPLISIPIFEPKPKIALVLGSGGPRGFAHIGVMKVFEESGIDYDLIVGSSVGSLIGAFWSAGYTATEIDELSKQGDPFTVFDFSLFADRGWIHGQRLQNYVNDKLGNRTIESLPRKFIAVATRIQDKQPVFFHTGNLGVSVRASSAVSKVFSPVGINGIEYEDGVESLPVAVRAARQAGATYIIAVDVTPFASSAPPNTSQSQVERALSRRKRVDPELKDADLVIQPNIGFNTSPTKDFFVKARMAGEVAARESLPSLLASLGK